MKNKILLSALLCATSSLMALDSEHAYLYKDIRIMGMGGANVAVGSYSTSVFSNPAGLSSIKKSDGYVVDILGVSASASSEIAQMMDDLGNADTDQETVDVLNKYNGQHFHAGVDNYSSVSKNSDMFAWSVGILAAADVNLMPHANGSADGGVLATSSRTYGGVILGASKPYETPAGVIDVGMGLKYISQNSYEGSLGVSELTNSDDIAQSLQDKYEKTSSGFGVDLGVNYHPFAGSVWHPTFGLSLLNIGSMDMSGNYGGQPMTVNFGMAVSPEVSFLDRLVLALDYVDMFNANTTRIYNFTDGTYSDYTESDMMKRLRLGASVGLIDNTYFATQLNVGMYQSAYTAGIDIRVTALKLSVATYEEQVGTGSVNIPDRRYMAQIGIGW
jgi:hypothetical protein